MESKVEVVVARSEDVERDDKQEVAKSDLQQNPINKEFRYKGPGTTTTAGVRISFVSKRLLHSTESHPTRTAGPVYA